MVESSTQYLSLLLAGPLPRESPKVALSAPRCLLRCLSEHPGLASMGHLILVNAFVVEHA